MWWLGIKTRKSSMKPFCRFVVSACSSFSRFVPANAHAAASSSYLGPPHGKSLVPRYSFVPTGISGHSSFVKRVLLPRAQAQVLPAIIQSIARFVIYFSISGEFKNRMMHQNNSVIDTSDCSEFRRIPISRGTPIPLVDSVKINSINERILSFCKRDNFVRLIWRLKNFVSFHTSFRHESTSHGFVLQPSF